MSGLFVAGCASSGVRSGLLNSSDSGVRVEPNDALALYQPFKRYASGCVEFGIMILDLRTGRHSVIETPFDVHLLEISKTNPELAVGANKYGPSFLVLDLKKQKIQQVYSVESGIKLTGHMCYSHDDKYLCATGIDYSGASPRDCIISFNPRNYKTDNVFYLPTENPSHHDCKFMNLSYTLVTTAGQAVDLVDVSKGTFAQRKVRITNSKGQLRHFSVNQSGEICAQANEIDTSTDNWRYRRAEIILLKAGDQKIFDLSSMPFEAPVQNAELLDFCFSGDGNVFGAVHAGANKVSFWNVATKSFEKMLDIPRAGRIDFDHLKNRFIIVSLTGIYFVSADSLNIEEHLKTEALKYNMGLSHRTVTTAKI